MRLRRLLICRYRTEIRKNVNLTNPNPASPKKFGTQLFFTRSSPKLGNTFWTQETLFPVNTRTHLPHLVEKSTYRLLPPLLNPRVRVIRVTNPRSNPKKKFRLFSNLQVQDDRVTFFTSIVFYCKKIRPWEQDLVEKNDPKFFSVPRFLRGGKLFS